MPSSTVAHLTSHRGNIPASKELCSAILPPFHAKRLFVIWPPLKAGYLLKKAMNGEMAEWSKARAWKVRIPVKGYRGFESLSLRHGMTSGEAAGMDAMATSRARSGEWTAHSSQGRNGRGHGMKPPPQGKADRREANPSLLFQATNRARSSERTALPSQGRNGCGHGMKPPPQGKADRREADPSLPLHATSRARSCERIAQLNMVGSDRVHRMNVRPTLRTLIRQGLSVQPY